MKGLHSALLVLLFGAALGGSQWAEAADLPDPEQTRLAGVLAALDADPALADKAALERFKARQALANAQAGRSRDRPHLLLVAAAWVEAADDAAHAEALLQQSAQLDRERDQIMLQASRRDAEMARREADRLRLQNLAREEEAQRLAEASELERVSSEQLMADVESANAQASQATKLADARARETALARKEAELAAAVAADSMQDSASAPPFRTVGSSRVYTLPGDSFASGSTQLTAAARAGLRQLATLAGARKRLRIEAHTDGQGADAANLALSQKRADAVRRVLQEAGIASGRMTALGKGEAAPVADNATPEGRARNRRVEISL